MINGFQDGDRLGLSSGKHCESCLSCIQRSAVKKIKQAVTHRFYYSKQLKTLIDSLLRIYLLSAKLLQSKNTISSNVPPSKHPAPTSPHSFDNPQLFFPRHRWILQIPHVFQKSLAQTRPGWQASLRKRAQARHGYQQQTCCQRGERVGRWADDLGEVS